MFYVQQNRNGNMRKTEVGVSEDGCYTLRHYNLVFCLDFT